MIIATWNVNSIRARFERLVAWLEKVRPDVLCLQELKVQDQAFPFDLLEDVGYGAVVHGQKTYNGVAILSRASAREVVRGMDEGADDPQARLIAATVDDLRIVSVYVPNGSEPTSDKYPYKLAWMARFERWLRTHHDPTEPLIVCGDLNVAPEDRDVHDPALWADTVLCTPAVREALAGWRAWGLQDLYRRHVDDAGRYSWWDYRGLAFSRDEGLRIDHVWGTAPAAQATTRAWIDRDERKGKRPSDHAPVLVELDW